MIEFFLNDILSAQKTIGGIADNTPLVPSPYMEKFTGHPFLLKLEIVQPVGAFKLRGAVNTIFNLDPTQIKAVTCCSTGNHGRGVAFAAKARGIRAMICMSELVPQTKIDGIKALGAEVKIIGRSQDDAQIEAERLCKEEGFYEISPFDDRRVIAGQGTIGLEILQENPDIETILVPLSGGGLAGGVACAAKTINPKVQVIGITMNRGAAMKASIDAGHPVEVEEMPSLADSLGGGIGLENKLSYPLCKTYLDDITLVTEEEIYDAMQTLYYEDRLIAEGASVVGLAAVKSGKVSPKGAVATIITSRNVDMTTHAKIMIGRDITTGETFIKGKTYAP